MTDKYRLLTIVCIFAIVWITGFLMTGEVKNVPSIIFAFIVYCILNIEIGIDYFRSEVEEND